MNTDEAIEAIVQTEMRLDHTCSVFKAAKFHSWLHYASINGRLPDEEELRAWLHSAHSDLPNFWTQELRRREVCHG